MNMFLKAAAFGAAFSMSAGIASAATYNFKELADGSAGESAYTTYSIGGIDFTASQNLDGGEPESAVVYLDAGNAGMGVCGYADILGPRPDQGSNVCLNADRGGNASDDSIQFQKEEVLTLEATGGPILLESIWVNYNHDPNSGAFDAWEWIIGGETYSVANGDLILDTLGGSGSDWRIDLGIVLNFGDPISIIMTAGPNSYISAISATPVPLPAAGWLLLAGLGGIAAMKRRKS